MNYQDLKIIMTHIQGKVKCHHCGMPYKDYGLNVVEMLNDKCLVVGVCFRCKKPSLIEVTIMHERKPVRRGQIQIRTRQHRTITENEILDIHNFLKNFNGDFKKLFTNSR